MRISEKEARREGQARVGSGQGAVRLGTWRYCQTIRGYSEVHSE